MIELDFTEQILKRKSQAEEEFRDVPVNIVSVDPDAMEELQRYFQKNPKAFEKEKEASGKDPLKDTIEYFKLELKEAEHDYVRLCVNHNGGRFTYVNFFEWAAVNAREVQEEFGSSN
jgi:hypothetical protein